MTNAKFDSYVICTSPRSGSTLLCTLLAATGVAGKPDSYFHRPSISDWRASLGLPPAGSGPERETLGQIFRTAIGKGSLDTGMFGLRLQRGSFAFFSEKLAVLHPGHTSDLERIEAAFGRTLFVHLTRRDKVEQAISVVTAHQTGLWHAAPDGTELERLSSPQQPVYDPRRIRTTFEEMTALDRAWERWFETEAVDPFRIGYEELSAHPEECLQGLLGELGLDAEAAAGVAPGVRKLADGTSREWAARFRSERNFI